MKYFAAILFLTAHIFAQELSPNKVLENVRTKYSHMNDIAADFTQSVNLRYRPSGQKTSGFIRVKKGNKYRVVTEQQIIVTDGKKVWMYTPSSKQVLVDVFKKGHQSFSPDKFLTGLPKDFTATKLDTAGGFFILTLQPSKSASVSSIMTEVTAWVNKESWLVENIEYTDKNRTATSIALSNIQFNNGIVDSSFQFEITPDMKIVDVNSLRQ